jgi:hypothetical protein
MNRRKRRNFGILSGDTSSSGSSEEDISIPLLQNEFDEYADIHSPTNGSSGKNINHQHMTPNRNKNSH